MSNETRVYGYIEVPVGTGIDIEQAIDLNWKAVNSLPEEGKWPWLIRGMFSLSPERVGYRGRLFHFAAAMKGVDEEWEKWLKKFERLLEKMFWITAELKLITEYSGDHQFSWVAELPESVMPVRDWEFIGSHRSFDHLYKSRTWQGNNFLFYTAAY